MNRIATLYSILIKIRWALVALLVIAVISCAGLLWWKDNQAKNSIQAGDLMYKALLSNNKNQDETIKLLNQVANIKSNYAYLAKLKLAGIYSKNDFEKAQKIYDELSSDSKINPVFKALATYSELSLLLKHSKFDLLKDKINNLSDNNIFSSSNKEIKALYMLSTDNKKEGIKILKELSEDFDTQFLIQKNAEELLKIFS